MTPKFKITAKNRITGLRMHLFTWTRGADQGIERAKRDAFEHDMESFLVDYRAEPIETQS